MRFDLTDLRLFLHVVESGSITHGAEKANMALPSASARLRGMEEVIGLPLLERGRRGVEPTPAGLTLAHHARLVLRQIEAMHGELGEFSAAIRAQVSALGRLKAIRYAVERGCADNKDFGLQLRRFGRVPAQDQRHRACGHRTTELPSQS